MKSVDLLDAIGEAKETYLLDAAQAWEATQMPKQGRPTLRKILFIAAVVALLTCLLGCAVMMLNLRDMVIAEKEVTREINENWEYIEPTEVTMSMISLGGYKDSPEFLATKEWYEFTESYDQDLSILASVDEDNLDIPVDYQHIYGCYTQEMVDKVDEIAEKYGLKLMGAETVIQRWQQPVLYESLGIEDIFHKEKAARTSDGSGYFYPNGDFQLEVEFLLPQENGNWSYEFWANLIYTKQGYFSPKYANVTIDDHEQWMYTTADGTDVLIAQNKGGAIFFTEQEDAYVTVILWNSMIGHEEGLPTKEDIQLAAEVIDFTIRPHEADLTNIQERLAEAEEAYYAAQEQKKAAVNSYGDLIRVNYIENAAEKIGTGTMRNYYALYDIDGNGVDELLLSAEADHFRDFYTMVDGDIVRCGIWSHYNLCENGIIMRSSGAKITGDKWYAFHEYDGKLMDGYLESILYIAEEDTWYRESMEDCVYTEDGTLESYRVETVPITAEEAQSILDKYVPIHVEMKPITEFPMN